MGPFPEEVDLFALPHACMRRLIGAYSLKHQLTNYQDAKEVESLLNDLQQVVVQVKSHEEIENKYIMQRLNVLPEVILAKPSSGHGVLDKHMASMMALLQEGCPCCKHRIPKRVCTRYGNHLRQALENFTSSFFLHMKEEEEVFQPILMEHLDYEELKVLRQVVLNHHQWTDDGLLAATVLPPLSVSMNRMRELEAHYCQNEKWEAADAEALRESQLANATAELGDLLSWHDCGPFGRLPSELKLSIFRYLNPADLEVCSKVCSAWHCIAFHSSFWHKLYPIQWARGDWSKTENLVVDEHPSRGHLYEEDDANTVNWLLESVVPHVGVHVHTLVLAGSIGLASEHLRVFLTECVNLTHLDISYTTVGQMAFAGLSPPSCTSLKYFEAAGNEKITDSILFRLARLWEAAYSGCGSQKKGLEYLSLSGCFLVTKYGLARLALSGILFPLNHLDLSGCAGLMGKDVAWITAHCPYLQPNCLYYCDNIEDGPYPTLANGCQNLGNGRRFCCRKD